MKVSSCDEPLSSYQRLDLFIKVLRVLCPNLTDASLISFRTGREKRVVLTFKPVLETINVLLFPSAGLQDVNYIAQRISQRHGNISFSLQQLFSFIILSLLLLQHAGFLFIRG